ncbi:hypothetical protein TA3x_000416 [Tundrisphaera sp. TA3]|uniref:hypothetical protein n=1 Tax=Tundrisphaera sp. TA3 TaxID=3435775 RepID=UPI003EBFA817
MPQPEHLTKQPRVVITNPVMGIYLGNCLGLGFWTLLDTAGQQEAVTFSSKQEAFSHIQSWDSEDRALDYRCVQVPTQREYATVSELAKAGLTHLLGDMLANISAITATA